VDLSDLASFHGPRRAEPATAPTPGRRGGTAGTTCCTSRTSCSSATTCRTGHGAGRARPARPRARPHDRLVLPPRSRPRLHPCADGPAGTLHPTRRRAGRLRLLPPHPAELASPLRQAGVALVQDLHPLFVDRGPRGTHQGAVIANGSLYCPCTPRPPLELAPLSRVAASAQEHDYRPPPGAAPTPAAAVPSAASPPRKTPRPTTSPVASAASWA
jgi:hypothetical protein